MYVAGIGPDKYLIKRMPDSGLEHAYHCSSYLPPEELSGLGHVLGSAITEEADSGLTTIKLGFRMSKTERAAPTGAVGGEVADSIAADPNRSALRAVLHYLWQEADLASWTPGMADKRNWRIVSRYLRRAARGKFTKGKPLATGLYVPEPFTVEKKAEITARRLSAWAPMQQHGSAQQFMMLIGELKAIDPARFGHKLVIKHLPDAPLMIDDTLPGPPQQTLRRRTRALAVRRRGPPDGHRHLLRRPRRPRHRRRSLLGHDRPQLAAVRVPRPTSCS
ncbi:DUF1173 domain-containing protein [Nocardioides sp. B-3]|nr:DUF1173 domain-containing protein [Nocardioides sp. B-3]